MLGLALAAGPLQAQDPTPKQTAGDSTLKAVITPQTRAIYDQGGTWAFALMRANPLERAGAYTTELRGTHHEGHFNRLIATAWTAEGKYNAEYYFDAETLLFVYETFEYVAEAAPEAAWRNFKGLASWERRSYFDGPSIGYAETVGAADPRPDAAPFIETATRLRAVLEAHRP